MSFLDEIIRSKREEVRRLKERTSLEEMRVRASRSPYPVQPFRRALEEAPSPLAVIAEIKHRSPSKGVFRGDFDPVRIARLYAANGAAALSVLTDQTYFGGSLADLEAVRGEVTLPVLRKDFIVDEIQVYESRAAGADAMLLIASVLSREELRRLARCAREAGLEPLVEVHGEAEIGTLEGIDALIGINNRDLGTFKVDVETTRRLLTLLPPGRFVISESGIRSRADLLELKAAGARAALIGETLLASPDPGAALRALLRAGTDG